MSAILEEAAGRHDPYAALRIRDFRYYLPGNVVSNLGLQMQTLAVEWEVYTRTGQPIYLGLVGLVEFLPMLLLALPAGHVADYFERRRIVIFANLMMLVASLGLAAIVFWQGTTPLIFCCVLLTGVARAIQQPAKSALIPQIMPPYLLANAITWSSGGFQLASGLGPAVGGFITAYAHSTAPVFVVTACMTSIFAGLVYLMQYRPTQRNFQPVTLRSLLEGVRFVRRSPIILATITLDLFAVLLGGAVGLFPIYARDILHVGPMGLGWMRAAPFIGALVVSIILAYRPPLRKAGPTLLWSVAGFGLATIVFGVSRSFPLSLVVLFLTGAFDMISVVVRHTLLQTLTPDAMRGRVSAINGIFIGASNELGVFESGAAAQLLGPTAAVVLGGIGTVAVVGAVTVIWPEVARYGRLGAPAPVQGFPVASAEATPNEKRSE